VKKNVKGNAGTRHVTEAPIRGYLDTWLKSDNFIYNFRFIFYTRHTFSRRNWYLFTCLQPPGRRDLETNKTITIIDVVGKEAQIEQR